MRILSGFLFVGQGLATVNRGSASDYQSKILTAVLGS